MSQLQLRRAARSVFRAGQLVLRKTTPDAAVPVIVSGRTWAATRRSKRLAGAVEEMRLVVGDGPPQEEVELLAARYLRRMAWRGETRWHPSWINQQEVVGMEHLEQALALGRGCILSFVHHADWEGTFPSIARHGLEVHALGSSAMFQPRQALWLRAQKRMVESFPGAFVVDVGGGSPVVRDLLGRGHVVGIALDVPGHTPLHYLGHDLMLSSGGTRIAAAGDVPVIVETSTPDTSKTFEAARVTLSPPLLPHDFASSDALLAEIARLHEEAILAWPEAMDRPSTLLDLTMVREPTEYRIGA